MKNTQKRIVNICIVLMIIFGLSTIFGLVSFNEIGDFAGFIVLVSLLISLTSFVCIFIFKKRSTAFDEAIQNKTGKIFTYTKEEWKKYLDSEYDIRAKEKRAIFIFLTTMTVPIFAIFIAIIIEAKFTMFLVGLGLICLYAIMAFVVPRINRRFQNHEIRQIMIFPKGIIIGKTFHTWDFPLSKLSSVKEKKTPFEHVQVSYEFFDRLGPRSYALHLPFPKNKEEFRKAIKMLK